MSFFRHWVLQSVSQSNELSVGSAVPCRQTELLLCYNNCSHKDTELQPDFYIESMNREDTEVIFCSFCIVPKAMKSFT